MAGVPDCSYRLLPLRPTAAIMFLITSIIFRLKGEGCYFTIATSFILLLLLLFYVLQFSVIDPGVSRQKGPAY